MKAVVVGGCGKIGTYLVPKLVNQGYEVTVITRGNSQPFKKNGAFSYVERVYMDRVALDKEGTFAGKVADMNPDIVVDLINFLPSSTHMMYEALKNTNIQQYLFCASIWVHGQATVVPATEDLYPRRPIEQYGVDKAASEQFLHEKYRLEGFPETVVCPGHITGPGWNCINPQGNLDPKVFETIAHGETLTLPNGGMECVHHVHADDVAQVFFKAITHREKALGETFHATAPAAMTLRGFAEAMYRYFGQEPKLAFLPYEEWCKFRQDPAFIASTTSHILHSDNYSIEKAKRLLEYRPRYTILEAVQESVESMIERNVIEI